MTNLQHDIAAGRPVQVVGATRPAEATPRATQRAPHAVRQFDLGTTLATLFLIAISAYFLVPLVWLLISATKDNTDLFATNGFWFGQFNLFTNIQQTFSHANGVFGYWMINTVLYAGVGACAATLIAAMAGYALSKYAFWGRSLFFSMTLGAILVPITTLALPIYLMGSKVHIPVLLPDGLPNTYWAVLLPSCISPLGVYLARIYATSAISNDLLDAARVDGAREFRIFWTIALRLMSPILVTIFLFQFVAIWNNYFLPLIMLSDPKMFPINLGLGSWNQTPADHEVVYNLIVTGSFLSVLPLIVAFIVLQRYWRSGLALGSVTG